MTKYLTSDSDEFGTPKALFDNLNTEFGFTLDPCASVFNHKCTKYFTKEVDGLVQPWVGETIFMNPPYSRPNKYPWMEKAYQVSTCGTTVVCLMPSDTDSRWWHEFAMKGEIRFIKGRVKFEGGASGARACHSIIVLGKKWESIFKPGFCIAGTQNQT